MEGHEIGKFILPLCPVERSWDKGWCLYDFHSVDKQWALLATSAPAHLESVWGRLLLEAVGS
jgi:hypothetical protein